MLFFKQIAIFLLCLFYSEKKRQNHIIPKIFFGFYRNKSEPLFLFNQSSISGLLSAAGCFSF
jgi:hypothetical protein